MKAYISRMRPPYFGLYTGNRQLIHMAKTKEDLIAYAKKRNIEVED